MGRYSRQFKQEAIKLVTEQGYKPAEAARKLGIPDTTFFKWVENSGWRRPSSATPQSDDPEVLRVQLREAQARLKELELENEILKKATAYFARQHL
jgi:transposase